MSESTAPSEDASVTFHVKSSSGPKCTLTLPMSTTITDLKAKLAEPEYANVPVNSQRLIYSGKVLKDHETLATHNVKEGNTMHLVRSAASNQRQNPSSQNTSSAPTTTPGSAPTGVPQTFASGTGNDPLAGLTGARYAGFAGLPNMQELANPPTMDEMMRRLQDPSFAQQMNEALQNPQMIDMMINMNPQLRAMGPQARQMLQSEQFRRMMTNPEAIRNMMEMQRAFGNDPFGGLGGGQEAFPMPGTTNTTDQQHRDQTTAQGQGQQQPNTQNPFGSPFGGGMNPFMFMPPQQQTQQPQTNPSDPSSTQPNTQPPNPFLALFPQGVGQQQPQTQGQTQQQEGQENNSNRGAGTDPSGTQANPFANLGALYNNPMMQQFVQQQMQNPEALQQAMRILQGGAGGGFDPMGMFGGGFAQPPDNRPPEERYATQLRQLNEMGFYNFDQNIQALTRSGGDVNGAVEWLFTQPQS